MAANDTILLDGLIERRMAETANTDRGEAFERLALEQLLKNYDLSDDEIDSGWVDGGADGGIDGLYVFVNGVLLDDPNGFPWPRSGAELTVHLITCKHHETFQQAPLDQLCATASELFDFSIADDALSGKYSDEIIEVRKRLREAYRRLSHLSPDVRIDMAYASRGDENIVGATVRARAVQLVGIVEKLFSSCTATFRFVGAASLVDLVRKQKQFRLELPFVEHLSPSKESHIVLVRISDYLGFITDADGNLRRHIFDSNVRDFMGESRVNEDIVETLRKPDGPEFWWLNNGVTILATVANVVGKSLVLQDIQIVNGLQTTESIFRHAKFAGNTHDQRSLAVKVIVSDDPSIRDQIIKATNNQNVVELAALKAGDKRQRDIEEILAKSNWFYERRKNYYKNIGKPVDRFVTPLYLAAGYVALGLKNPSQAKQLRQRAMHNELTYEAIFPTSVPLGTWVAVAEILKRVDAGLEKLRPTKHSERFLANYRWLVGVLAVARVHGGFDYGVANLPAIDSSKITDEMIQELHALVHAVGNDPDKKTLGKAEFCRRCATEAAAAYSLRVPQAVCKLRLPLGVEIGDPPTDRELELVEDAIGNEPLVPGIHLEVAKQTGLKPETVSRAIAALRLISWKKSPAAWVVDLVDGNLPQPPWDQAALDGVAKALNMHRAEVRAAILELCKQGRRNKSDLAVS